MLERLEPERILLVRLGGFGDVVFTLPAVQRVRAAFPRAHLSFLVYKEFASLLEGFPGVENVLTLDRQRYQRFNPVTVGAETFSLLCRLRRGRFGLVVDFQGFGETGLLSWLSGAPQRWGSVYRPGRRWAYTQPVRRDPQLHPVDYHLAVVLQGGRLKPEPVCSQFALPPKALAEGRQFFSAHGLQPDRPTLFIQPFTSSRQKNWPLGSYLGIAEHWRGQGVQVLFGGGPGEQAALEPARQAGFPVAAGTPALLSASLARLSSVVVGGDTGLVHLALAMGLQVRMIMQSCGAGACFPFGHPDWAILPPTGASLEAITRERVNEACAQALAETAAA